MHSNKNRFYINISVKLIINAGKHRKTALNAKTSSRAKPGALLVYYIKRKVCLFERFFKENY